MRKTLSLPPTTRRERDEEPDPEDLDPALGGALEVAGLSLGAPMGRDRPGHLAPRRGLDAQDRDVVVHVVALPEGPAGARALRRLADLRSLRHPAVAPVREVVALPGNRAAVTVDLVAGADLAVVLGARGALTRSESARVLEDLGGALAHLHEHGVTHGDVSPANVVVSAAGRPVLVDLLAGVMETGTQGCAAPERSAGGAATPASDVYSLAALLTACASGSALLGRRLAQVLSDALDADPNRRPSARELAARVPELAAPGDIDLPDGARLAAGALRAAAARPTRVVASRGRGRLRQDGDSRRERDPGPRRRRAVLALALAAATLAGALLAPGSPFGLRDDDPAGSAGAGASPAAGQEGGEDLLPVVVSLAAARDVALNAGDAEALAATTVPGSPAAQADEEMLAALRDSGETVSDLETSVSGVEMVEVPADRAARWPDAVAVRLSRAQQPSTRTAADGTSRTVPAQASHEIVLILIPDPWRVAEVLPAE